MRSPLRSLLAVSVMTGLLLVGCSSSGDDDKADKTTTTVAKGDETTTTAAGGDDETTTTEASDDTTTTTEADDGDTDTDGVCAALKKIADYDKQTSEGVDTTTPWPELQKLYVDSAPKVLAAYDEAIDAADGSIKEDLQTLRDFTEPTADIAKESTSLTDFGTKLTSQPGLTEAGVAGQNLATYSEETCGFSTSSGR